MSISRYLGLLLCASLFLTCCAPRPTAAPLPVTPEPALPSAIAAPESTSTPTQLPPPTAAPTQEAVYFLWVAPYLSQALEGKLGLPENVIATQSLAASDFRIEVGAGKPVSQWIYALVAPFPTIPDGISAADLNDFWKGLSPGLFNGQPIGMDEITYQVFSIAWGSPARGAAEILPGTALLEHAWSHQSSWAIVPFEALVPRWKVLSVDGITPFDATFEAQTYPLTIPITIQAAANLPITADQIEIKLPASNLDPNQMTQVAITGVTALMRGTAVMMNKKGILYPAEETGALLRAADITHISNEIPFFSQCPAPELEPFEEHYCSDPAYIALLEEVGTDVVELTGDHLSVFGAEGMLETLTLYRDNGIPYYGGGKDIEEARRAVILEHHGNRMAFIGCNAKGIGFYASASESLPGAAACDLDWMETEIARLRSAGYLVIATLQHIEYDAYNPDPALKADLQRLARAGATIVSGSQAHVPHGMTFLEQAFIHYGLGNLFFDQYLYFAGGELDYAFIDWHIFYAGRHISTRLITISWMDLAKNRLTTPAERQKFLQTIFDASQWTTK